MSEELKDQSLEEANITSELNSDVESIDAPVALEEADVASVETDLIQEEELAPVEEVVEAQAVEEEMVEESIEPQPVVQEKVAEPIAPVVEVKSEPEVIAPVTEEQLLKRIGELRTQIDSYIFEVDSQL